MFNRASTMVSNFHLDHYPVAPYPASSNPKGRVVSQHKTACPAISKGSVKFSPQLQNMARNRHSYENPHLASLCLMSLPQAFASPQNDLSCYRWPDRAL